VKLLASLIITASLIVGSLSAATAYLAPTTLPDERLLGLTLRSSVGATTPDQRELAELHQRYEAGELTAEQYISERSELKPIIDLADDAETLVNEQMLQRLKQPEGESEAQTNKPAVEHLHVKQFSLARWPHKWWFGLSVVGLLAGAMMLRRDARAKVIAAESRVAEETQSPEGILETIRSIVESLLQDLPATPDDQRRCDLIVERLDQVQRTHAPAFVDLRPVIVSRLGVAGYAQLMDRFAAAERQINRAWSAAADGHEAEARQSLERIGDPLRDAMDRLAK